MSITRHLYQLQEIDLDIEAHEQSLSQKERRLRKFLSKHGLASRTRSRGPKFFVRVHLHVHDDVHAYDYVTKPVGYAVTENKLISVTSMVPDRVGGSDPSNLWRLCASASLR